VLIIKSRATDAEMLWRFFLINVNKQQLIIIRRSSRSLLLVSVCVWEDVITPWRPRAHYSSSSVLSLFLMRIYSSTCQSARANLGLRIVMEGNWRVIYGASHAFVSA
jgi:hypothetical protein